MVSSWYDIGMNFKSTRKCAGYYIVSDGTDQVEVIKQDFFDGPGWLAIALWTRHRVTDPLKTKHEAMICAHEMLKTKFI